MKQWFDTNCICSENYDIMESTKTNDDLNCSNQEMIVKHFYKVFLYFFDEDFSWVFSSLLIKN